MQIILLEKIHGLGDLGETVTVKAGYARNFLLPQQKALPASKANLAKYEAQRAELEANMAEARTAAEKLSEQLKDTTVELVRAASETGQLYGSVKPRDVVNWLTENKNVTVERAQVLIGEPIKEIGEHTINLALHADVVLPITVTVKRQTN